MIKVNFEDLGKVDYQKAWDYQTELFDASVNNKIANRKEEDETKHKKIKHHLLFCEHPHVYTLGKSGDASHLLLQKDQLEKNNVQFYKINRGGDITYHGPGQIVGYPIFDLDQIFTDIHKYLRFLEDAVMMTIAEYGIKSERLEGLTGVWIDPDHPAKARKICAMGVKCSRWVTMHGLALNVNTDLNYFNHIVPCGISDKQVTSMQKELGEEVNIEEVKEKLKNNIAKLFEIKYA